MQLVSSNDEILLKPCRKVSVSDGLDIARKMTYFLEKMNKKADKRFKQTQGKDISLPRGIGLAANQVGIDAAVCIIRSNGYYQPLVNPRIVKWGNVDFSHKEGCLSYPGVWLEVYRLASVAVEADNLPHGIYSEEPWVSAVLQHEIAHTAGLTIYDFVTQNYPKPDQWEEYVKNRSSEVVKWI